jgi:hypothetical protein
MPNYCDNTVTLRHSDKSLVDALDAELSKKTEGHYGSQGQLLNFLRPNPSGEWEYNWSVDNWGTKWDANIIDWERRDDNEIWVSFESAWSPPTKLYEYIVEQGWQVDALYLESGMGYAGTFTTDGGDDYYEYDITDIESVKELPSDLIEFGDLLTRAEEYLVERLAEDWADAERSQWFPMDILPSRDGYYELQIKHSHVKGTYINFVEFKNGSWDIWSTEYTVGWRGLTEDPDETKVD